MRKFVISLAAAATALAFASPAAAQYFPQPVGYGSAYGSPGETQALQMQISQLRMEIRQLGMSNMLSRGEFRRLDWEAGALDQRIRAAAFNGISPGEGYDIQRRIARLQQRIQFAMSNGNRRYGYGYGRGGYGGYGGYAGYGYGGLNASFGRTGYYGGSPSHSGQAVQVMQRMPASMGGTNVMLGSREMQRMPSMNAGNDRRFSMGDRIDRGFSSRGGDMQRMPSMRTEGRSSSFGGRGMGRGRGRD